MGVGHTVFRKPKNGAEAPIFGENSMLESNVTLLRPVYKLIPLIPDSDLSRLLRVGFELADTEPRLLERIEKDLDAYAIEKKKRRLEDRA